MIASVRLIINRIVLSLFGAVVVSSPAYAASVATFDFASASDTVTAAGVAVLAVSVVYFTFNLAIAFVFGPGLVGEDYGSIVTPIDFEDEHPDDDDSPDPYYDSSNYDQDDDDNDGGDDPIHSPLTEDELANKPEWMDDDVYHDHVVHKRALRSSLDNPMR